RLRDVMNETRDFGFERARERQIELGRRVGALLEERGFPSVAGEGFKAPCVVVSYTDDADIVARFAKAVSQFSAGGLLNVGKPDDSRAFRIGLFGLHKLDNVCAPLARLTEAFERALGCRRAEDAGPMA